MTEFFRWRSCDLTGLGVREAIGRNSDLFNRGVAILEEDSGLPADDTGGPTLDIASAAWGDEEAGGDLPAGTYDYDLVPVDTCTGQTGAAIPLPSMTLTAPNKRRKLRVTFNTKPTDCQAAFIRRDGLILGKPFPLSNQVLDNVPVVTTPTLIGDYSVGTEKTFDRDSGADLVVNDAVLYPFDDPLPSYATVVRVKSIAGDTVTFEPPIVLDRAAYPDGFFDVPARIGVYAPADSAFTIPNPNATISGILPLGGLIPLPIPTTPLNSFKTTAVGLGFSAVPQFGDIITYGSKTAIVIGLEYVTSPGFVNVLVLPFGLLPIPPLPIGLYFLCHRLLNITTSDLQSLVQRYTDGTASGFQVTGNPPSGIAVGDTIIYGGSIVNVTTLTPDGVNTDVTITPSIDASVTPDSVGLIFKVPDALSPLLSQTSIAATGQYKRLTRVVTVSTQSNLWQWEEDGSLTGRAGTIGPSGEEARNTLNNVFSQAGYRGGLDTLLERLRGPSDTLASRRFNETLGMLTQAEGSKRMFAVNDLAREGNGVVVNLTNTRNYRSLLCNSFANVSTTNDLVREQGVAVQRFEQRAVVVPAAKCPPGEAATTTNELFCLGAATTSAKVNAGEYARVFWSPSGRFAPGARQRLIALGLTDDEAAGAIELAPVGRVVNVVEWSSTDMSDISDVNDVGTPDQVDEVLDEGRITNICLGKVTRRQIGLLLAQRGSRGISLRLPGTLGSSEQGARPVEDFTLLAHSLTALSLQYRETFDICDFDAALASIPDVATRNAVGGVFALIEATLNHAVDAGRALDKFLNEGEFAAARDTVAGLVAAIAADPTLNCLIGPINQNGVGLPSIPQVDLALQGFAFPFQVRFQLSSIFASMLQSVLCALLGELLKLLPGDAAAFTSRVIGCLPSQEDLALAGFEFPSLDVQVALECGLEQLNILADLLSELIAEANEVIALANFFGAGFVWRQVEARNRMCSGSESIADVFGQAVRGLGLDQIVNVAANTAG